jgi:hypothetical protein
MSEQDQLKALIQENRHNELIAALQDLLKKEDKALLDAINSQGGVIAEFVQAIKNLPAPTVEIETNQDKVVSSIEQLAQQILLGQEQILSTLNRLIIENSKLKEWDFTIHKEFGKMSSVTAKQIK